MGRPVHPSQAPRDGGIIMEKKCFNCRHIIICTAYHRLSEMANTLNTIMRENPIGENGFTVLINAMAHDCVIYEEFKDDRK